MIGDESQRECKESRSSKCPYTPIDGQQRLTSMCAVIRGKSVSVRGRKKPIEILFNLDHSEGLVVVTEVNEDAVDDEDDMIEDATDSSEDELQQ
jgi:hypothetical protein